MATFILPFDHRSGFAREIMQTAYPFSPADRARAQELKQVIYDGFLEAYHEAQGSDVFGILIDEETGAGILHDAHNKGILTILTLEASGEAQLRLQYGDQSPQRLRMLSASLGKVLLRFSDLPAKSDRQLQMLQQICAQLANAGQRILIELLSTGTEEEREAFLVHTVSTCTEMGIIPEFWKVESLPSVAAWKHVKETLHASSALLLLGRGEDRAHVEAAVRTAAESGVVDGFVIGRTLFADELRGIVSGKKKRAAAVRAIADNFSSMIRLWKSV